MALDPAAVLKPATLVRDQHLLPGSPKRVLALDGGGVRGLITLGILQRVEDLLASQLRPEDPTSFRLAHYFDLIGGTSTGSIIAASLALGHTVEQVRQSYLTFAPKIFKESDRQGFFKPKFDKAAIDAELRTQFEDHTLDSPSLITGLAICTKRMDTGSPWVLFNHPGGEFWDKDKNSDFLLRDVIRASAAAPYFFDPHKFVVGRGKDDKGEEGIFVDGGVAGLNNPSVELLTLVLQKDYPFHWNAGTSNLFMLSVGSGWFRERHDAKTFMNKSNLEKAKDAMVSMIHDTQLLGIKTMQTLSVPPRRDPRFNFRINAEIETMPSLGVANPPLLTFRRLDASLERFDLEPVVKASWSKIETKQKYSDRLYERLQTKLRQIDNAKPDTMAWLYEAGYQAGAHLANERASETLDVF